MLVKRKDYKNRNRYRHTSEYPSDSFKKLLAEVKILRHFELSYEYLKKYPKQKVMDEHIKKSLAIVTSSLYNEGMSMSMLAKLYSKNISDNSLRTYFNNRINRKAQTIIFSPIEAKIYGQVVDGEDKIEEPLKVQMTIKKDVRRKARDRYKTVKLT